MAIPTDHANAPAAHFFLVDAFSSYPFSGHLAAVVLWPDAGDDPGATKAMQRIAAELRVETAFVLATTGDAPVAVRYFTPVAESDGGGHVTVAAYVALVDAGRVTIDTGGAATVRQRGRSGAVDIKLVRRATGELVVTTAFERPHFGAALDRDEISSVLRIPESAILHAPRVVQLGAASAIGVVALANATTLHGARPDFAALASLSRRRAFQGLAVFARPGVEARSAVAARFFFPAVSPDEDVVSSSGLACVGAYAVRERVLPCVLETTIATEQGHALGRPNRAAVTVRATGGVVSELEVAGEGIVTARGTLRLPVGL